MSSWPASRLAERGQGVLADPQRGVVSLYGRAEDAAGPGVVAGRGRGAASLVLDDTQVAQRRGEFGMVRAEHLFLDREAPGEQFGRRAGLAGRLAHQEQIGRAQV